MSFYHRIVLIYYMSLQNQRMLHCDYRYGKDATVCIAVVEVLMLETVYTP